MSTLHTLRRQANLSLTALAEQSGVSVRRLAEYEYGDVPLDVIDRSRLAAFFGVDGTTLAGSRRPIMTPLATITRWRWWLIVSLLLGLGFSSGIGWQTAGAALEPLETTPTPRRIVLSFPTLTAQLTQPQPDGVAQAQPTPGAAVLLPAQRAYAVAKPERCPLLAPDGVVLVTGGYVPPQRSGVELGVDLNGDGEADGLAQQQALVVAAHAGTIEFMRPNEVVVRGVDGWRTTYAPISALAVQAGERVRAGQLLGTVAAMDQAAPFLRFAVWQQEHSRDPSEFVLCAAHNHAPLSAAGRVKLAAHDQP